MATIYWPYLTGKTTLYAYPKGVFDDWATLKVLGVEIATGLYAFTVSGSEIWGIFDAPSGAPGDWADALTDLTGITTCGILAPGTITWATTSGLLNLYAYPIGVFAAVAPYRVHGIESESGLYTFTIPDSNVELWAIFDVTTAPADWFLDSLTDLISIRDCVVDVNLGDVPNLLSVDYEDDWVYLDGIENLSLTYGGQRTEDITYTPPETMKAKRSSPNEREVAIAAGMWGYEVTDIVFVVWSQTIVGTLIGEDNKVLQIRQGDKITAFKDTAFEEKYVVKSIKINQDFAQQRCYCKLSSGA